MKRRTPRRGTPVDAKWTPSPNPLLAPTTALAKTPEGLAIGLPDGGVALYDGAGRTGVAIRLPSPAAPTRRIFAVEGGVAWESGGALYQCKRSDRTVEQLEAWPVDETPLYQRTPYEIRFADGRRCSTVYKQDFPGGDGPVVLTGERLWWGTRDMVLRGDPMRGPVEAYLPWAGAGGTVNALLEDGATLWIGTERGVGKLTGYVRARLDPADEVPPARYARLVDVALKFVGAPYVYGGDRPEGCDCSGFVTAVLKAGGVNAPRTSRELAQRGRPVTGDLKWGDLICTPGHVALYLGNGRTIEAFNTSMALGFATVWHRNNATARRYLA